MRSWGQRKKQLSTQHHAHAGGAGTGTGTGTMRIACDESLASMFSRAFFCWVTPMIARGWKAPIQLDELPAIGIGSELVPDAIAERFDTEWAKERHRSSNISGCSRSKLQSTPSLVYALYPLVSGYLVRALLSRLVAELIPVFIPILVKMTTTYAQHKRLASHKSMRAQQAASSGNNNGPLGGPPDWQGYALTFGMFTMLLLYSWSFQWFYFEVGKATIIVRTALASAIYRKSLVLSAQARSQQTLGRLTNLISSDLGQIERGVTNMLICITIPVQVVASIIVLMYMIGPSSICGWALVVAFVPVQMWCSRYLVRLRRNAVQYTDRRIRATREALQGMKVVKFFVWEESIRDNIERIRKQELKFIAQINLIRYGLISLALHSPVVASMLTFVIFTLAGGKLKTGPVFAVIGIFNSMTVPLSWLPGALTETRNSLVPLSRITEALLEEEIDPSLPPQPGLDVAVRVLHGRFAWRYRASPVALGARSSSHGTRHHLHHVAGSRRRGNIQRSNDMSFYAYRFPPGMCLEQEGCDSQSFHLDDINIEIAHGALVAIIGPVGSGKSSLMNALVGEMKRISGAMVFGGTLGYAAQVPWIMNATVRDNITFGLPFDEERYANVVEACALDLDFAMLPGRDMAEIGERGVTLSGGQRQRVSIARAAYAESDIVLLDDCLSSVDVKISHVIFRHCIKGVLAGKTRILVTNCLDYLSAVDHIITMDSGRIAEQGSFANLMALGGMTAAMVSSYASNSPCDMGDEMDGGLYYATDSSLRTASPIKATASYDGLPTTTPSAAKLMSDEERATGQVSLPTYAAYIRAGGGWWVFSGIVFCLAVSQGCCVGSDFWMRIWIKHKRDTSERALYIGVYALLGGLQLIWFVVFAAMLVASVYKSSQQLHSRALKRILMAPMSFFDTTPLGRMLNRFTRDIDSLDLALCDFLRQFYQNIARSVGSFVSITILVPIFLGPLVPLFVASWVLIYVYLRSSVEIQRVAAISRSPLYAHYTETLQGLPTIRACRAQVRYVLKNNRVLDDANRPLWYSLVAQSWVWLRVNYLSHLLTLVVCIIIVAQPSKWDAAAVGLMLVQATQMGAYVSYAGRGWTELQNNMNSVERINHYATALDQEADGAAGRRVVVRASAGEVPMRAATSSWPERGTLIIHNLSMRYRPELALALRGISLEVSEGERVGIVGRSGAGKSSIVSALFRLVEPASGKIFIDGVDVQTLPLGRLRRSICILPQDPVLFDGTLRTNLDPLHEFSDTEIWAALGKVCLRDTVALKPAKLEMPVGEGGVNFSAGQRQLVCLARALLRRPKILVLDEATANVDHETDAAIQRVILSDIQGTTVISIAHRLQTIIGYDKVAVVDDGKIVEFGAPLSLLRRHLEGQNAGGTATSDPQPSVFYAMVQGMGEDAARHMAMLAQAAEENRGY
ncbi:P-loop containing nucleoside triphosphate hydrolase protein [Martensiomyces pterosporus]|nr:P-loop containing nucleoside triphosphate hydrolase protein [Martensiomyces pterosporus]